jgi:hypothetical protein
MFNEEYEVLLKKSIEVVPDWVKKDIQSILNKADVHAGISHVISQLHDRYSFNLRHILAALDFSDEWARVSRERLNFIDNNIEVIVALYQEIKNKQ